MPQTGDLPVINIRRENEIENKNERAQPADSPESAIGVRRADTDARTTRSDTTNTQLGTCAHLTRAPNCAGVWACIIASSNPASAAAATLLHEKSK